MKKYLSVTELMALPRAERIAYTQAMHENTMNNLRLIPMQDKQINILLAECAKRGIVVA